MEEDDICKVESRSEPVVTLRLSRYSILYSILVFGNDIQYQYLFEWGVRDAGSNKSVFTHKKRERKRKENE